MALRKRGKITQKDPRSSLSIARIATDTRWGHAPALREDSLEDPHCHLLAAASFVSERVRELTAKTPAVVVHQGIDLIDLPKPKIRRIVRGSSTERA